MKSTKTIVALFVAILALPMAAVGQDEERSDDQAIDDIVVVGKKSTAALRRDIFQSEEDFYALYNRLNDDDEYDVRCFYETPTGTRMKNHVCRAVYISNSYSKHASRNGFDVKRVANQDASSAMQEKNAKFQEKLETLIAANPDLQAALIRYNTARARFMEQREESARN